MIILKYLKRLFSLWTTIVFTAVDIATYVISASSQNIIIPAWVYWAIAGVGFFIADLQLYAQQEKRITEYETTEADLIIRPTEGYCYFQHYEGKLGLDERGRPIKVCIFAKVEIENLGKEWGIPVCEVDTEKSRLPDIFSFDERNLSGEFLGKPSTEVNGRDRISIDWEIPIRVMEQTPEVFAQRMRGIGGYKLLIRYRTKRIGGFSKPREAILVGSFDKLKEDLVECWQRIGYSQLCDILKPQS